MHLSNLTPPMKGTWIPETHGEQFADVVTFLSQQYRYVGDKVALRWTHDAQWPAVVGSVRKRWLESSLPSRVILTAREPSACLASNLHMFRGREDRPEDLLAIYVNSLAVVTWLQLAVFHSDRLAAFVLVDLVSGSLAHELTEALDLGNIAIRDTSVMALARPSAAASGKQDEMSRLIPTGSDLSETFSHVLAVYRALEVSVAEGHAGSVGHASLSTSSKELLHAYKGLHMHLLQGGQLVSSGLWPRVAPGLPAELNEIVATLRD